MLCVLFFCVFLWEIEHTHSMRWHTNNSLGSFFSHRTHRFNRTFQPTFRTHRAPPAYIFHRTLHPPLAVTFCDICMLEAFCEIETVRKKVLLNLWVLWEKKNPHELNSTLKCSVKSVSSVRDKAPQRVSKMFFFSQSTQKNRTHKGAQRH